MWFGGVLLLVVWTWMNYVFYTRRLDTDDIVHRLMKTAAMVAIAAAAVNAPAARVTGAAPVVLSYVSVRVVLVAFYWRALRNVPEARREISISSRWVLVSEERATRAPCSSTSSRLPPCC